MNECARQSQLMVLEKQTKRVGSALSESKLSTPRRTTTRTRVTDTTDEQTKLSGGKNKRNNNNHAFYSYEYNFSIQNFCHMHKTFYRNVIGLIFHYIHYTLDVDYSLTIDQIILQ